MTNRFENAPRWQRVTLVIALFLLVLIVIASLGEAAVRLRAYVNSPIQRIENLYTTDATTGLRMLKPGIQSGALTINSRGFRGPEVAMPKPDDVVRIAFLGASTTFSAEVGNDDATWPHLVVRKLRNAYEGTNFDYINAGVPGFSAEDSLLMLRTKVAPLRPNIIIIYHATNDLSANSREVAKNAGLAVTGGDKDLTWVSEHSMLSYLIEKNIRIIARQQQSENPEEKIDFDTAGIAEPFREDLRGLVQEARQVAQAVALVTFSTHLRDEQSPEQQKDAAVTALFYMPFMTNQDLLKAYAAYNDVIREVGRSEDVYVIGDEMRIPGDHAHFVDSVHFTDAGSRVMADRVFDGLLRQGVIETVIDRQSN